MPSFMQGFKLAHDRNIKAKPLCALIMVVILVTLITSVWMNVKLGYEVGALSLDEWYARAQEGVPATSAARLIILRRAQVGRTP
jgi:hypothetical protein